MKNLVKSLIVISAVIFLFSSCDSDDKPETESTVKVVLTDGPFPFDFVTQANVDVAKIELKTQNGEYVTVFEGSGSFNQKLKFMLKVQLLQPLLLLPLQQFLQLLLDYP